MAVSEAAGLVSLGVDAPQVTLESTFEWSSSTKVVTAIAALQCVERGQIGLDDPTADLLPELSHQQILSLVPQEHGEPQIKFITNAKPLSLRQLLTHTSGLGSEFIDPRLQAWRKSVGTQSQAIGGNALESIDIPLLFEPGQGWAYGSGYDAIAVLIGRLNGGINLEEYCQQHIFQPLGLKASTFMPEDHSEITARLVQCVIRTPEGKLVPHQHGSGKNPALPQGGGGLYSTVGNHHAILADVVSEHPKLLRPETARLLFTPQLKDGTAAMTDFKAMRPLLNSMLGSLIGDQEVNHSLGGVLVMANSSDVGRTKGTAAWAGATGTFWMMNQERQIAASYASQLFPIMDPVGLKGIAAFVEEVWQKGEASAK